MEVLRLTTNYVKEYQQPGNKSHWWQSYTWPLSLRSGQTRMRIDESWEAKVCMTVLSTLLRRSNEARVDETWSLWKLPSHLNKACIFFGCKFSGLANIKFCWLRLLTGSLWVSVLELSLKKDTIYQLSWLVKDAQTLINSHPRLTRPLLYIYKQQKFYSLPKRYKQIRRLEQSPFVGKFHHELEQHKHWNNSLLQSRLL